MINPTFAKRRGLIILQGALALSFIMLSGCNKQPADTPASQVAAKVNGAEITLHQLNQVLSRAGNIPPAQQEQARRSVLDNLVNQQLMSAKAVGEKLDRTPETLMALEAARREVLARAYMEKVMATVPKLNSGDVPRYYLEHPELFAERKVYNLLEIVFQAPEADLKQIQSMAEANAPTEKIIEFMKSKSIVYRGNALSKGAEQLPVGLVKQLHAAKDGDSIMINGTQGQAMIRVVSSRKQPVDEANAAPAIQRFLMNQRITEAMEKEVKALRDAAKIEYVGTFANVAKAPTTPPQAPATAVTSSAPAAAESATSTGLTAGGTGPLKLPPLPHEDPNFNASQLPGQGR